MRVLCNIVHVSSLVQVLSLLTKTMDEKKKKMTEEVITTLECVVVNEFMQVNV